MVVFYWSEVMIDEEWPIGWVPFKLYLQENRYVYLVGKLIYGPLIGMFNCYEFYQVPGNKCINNAFKTPYLSEAQELADKLNGELNAKKTITLRNPLRI